MSGDGVGIGARDVISEVRHEREELARVLKNYTGIRKIVEELYPDSAHFIYELLQNAEDTGATEATFLLSPASLVFEHNGRPFEEHDIFAITNIGEGTKAEDDDKIGRFGVGFKAVFAYSETPHIWSPTFSFKIEELVLPSPIAQRSDIGRKTRFEFPFNNPKKLPGEAYAEIEDGLHGLSETALLFLSNLQFVAWRTSSGESRHIMRIQHVDNHTEVLMEGSGEATSSLHFLKFEQPAVGLDKQRVSAAFALDFLPGVRRFAEREPLAKQFKIAPARGTVSVYFPAEKETSGLRFHLHGPFVPELSRASIKETPANTPLFEQVARLVASSLHSIRDYRFLNTDFLEVLPNAHDEIPARYEAVREAIVDAMNAEALTPTHDKLHAPARRLLQAKASLKNMLSADDLEYLVEYEDEPPLWAVGANQKNTNADRFLDSLDIEDWGIEEFATRLIEDTAEGGHRVSRPPHYAYGPDSDFIGWLSNKPAEWHQQLYALLYAEYAARGGLSRFRGCRIVRLADGRYSTGEKCFFPDEKGEGDTVAKRVDVATYRSGKSKTEQSDAKKFLIEIGVRELGEAEQIELILKENYGSDIPELLRTEQYCETRRSQALKHLKRFIALLESEPGRAGMFRGYYIFECADGQWRQPTQVYLDAPFVDTGLGAYYHALGEKANLFALSERYRTCGIAREKIASFASRIGASTSIKVEQVSTKNHPQERKLREDYYSTNAKWTHYAIDEDWMIRELATVLSQNDERLSLLLWTTMCGAPEKSLTARFRPNSNYWARTAPSSLILLLRDAYWVPQGAGTLAKPSQATSDLLPSHFAFDPNWPWLKAIEWGKQITERSEQERQRNAYARELGFGDPESLERARRFAALPRDDQERILADLEGSEEPELPDDAPANPERRAAKIAAAVAMAPERITEQRTRSVSVGRDKIKQEAAQYLRQQYTLDGRMYCQACEAPVPFTLEDGLGFFEKVEFLPELRKRRPENYIALCPNHAAMFQLANGSAELMRDIFVELSGQRLEVVLAQRDCAIYFTQKHIVDLKSLIAVDQSMATNEEDDHADDLEAESS